MNLDLPLVLLERLAEQVRDQLSSRSAVEWVLGFAPILFLLEFPRYYVPAWCLALRGWLGADAGASEKPAPRANPLVTCLVAARNEEASLDAALRSLLEQDYSPIEILVVDDASDDGTAAIASRHAKRGAVRYVRNRSPGGRGGKPSASNLGLRLARGEFVVMVDADGTLDRSCIRELVRRFDDPRVGVVAGNVRVRNVATNLLTRVQALEYVVGIDLRKRWTDRWSCTLFASGALAAFRRGALVDAGGWTADVAEDSEVCLRLRQRGWRIAFAPNAIAMTDAPESSGALARQRTRWDRAGFRVFFRRHRRLLRPSMSGWAYASELWQELYYTVAATLLHPAYLAWLLFDAGPFVVLFVVLATGALNAAMTLSMLPCMAKLCPHVPRAGSLVVAALVTPFFKAWLRWVRFRALALELLRIRVEDPFLPESAWRNAPRF